MPVALVGNTGASYSNGSSFTFAYSTSAGADRLLIVGTWPNSAAVASVSYAGQALTEAAVVGGTQTWVRVAPTSGSNSVSVVLSAYGSLGRAVSDWTGVDQTTPYNTPTTASGSGGTVSSGSVTCPKGGAIHGWQRNVYTQGGSFSANSGTTLLGSLRDGGAGFGFSHSYRTATGSLNITLPASAGLWEIVALPLRASVSGLPTLSASTFKPGTLTSTGWTARITAS